MEVLSLIHKGLIGKEVAATLKISVRTVETYRRNINAKLGVRNAVAALHRAKMLNMIL